jgi:hypothetical protein
LALDLGSLLGGAGQVLLAVCLVVAAGASLSTVPRLLRIRRRAMALSAQLDSARLGVEEQLALLAERSAETDELLQPLLRLRRWLGHPLSVALIQSYLRRRRAH